MLFRSCLLYTAVTMQLEVRVFSIVEVLCTCPTNWGMTPAEAAERVNSEMIPYYPLGIYLSLIHI